MPQQRPRPRTGGPSTPARLVRRAALAGSLALILLTAACGGGEDDAAARSKSSKKPTISAREAQIVAPAKVEVIASLTKCKVEIRVEAEELRDGVCRTERGAYLITTFPKEKHQRTWLDTSSMYQGTYLVGPRWVISAQPKLLEQLRSTLGGSVIRMTGMGPASTPSSS
ncbi:hypothetical protein Q5762_03355 [Streptomyces sp. P9(2023)]|uniref:hypothetical protein n=1 Tax=Streptomyces sp. P9(2023) TaxID=3064394 RepID=UPI0028F43703|nr:hypothetical protein [Streptomyces sp. P9(2023)]MDT9687392.1 hypothetical protein [Streptomyces sp. P9(2023)]